MRSFYEVLGIGPKACDAEVRSAYRRQALATHPDKGGAAEVFHVVLQAFETLGDPTRRAEYDRSLQRHVAHRLHVGAKQQRPKDEADVDLGRPPKRGRPSAQRAHGAERAAASAAAAGVGAPRARGGPGGESGHGSGAEGRSGSTHRFAESAAGCASDKAGPGWASAGGSSLRALLLQLLRSPRAEVTTRLRNMPEPLLAQLAAELEASMEEDWSGESEVAEASTTQDGDVGPTMPLHMRRCSDDVRAKAAEAPGEYSSSSGVGSSSDEEAEHLSLAICDGALGAESDADVDELFDDMEATPVQPTSKSKVSRARGVFKLATGGYNASICMEYMEIRSCYLKTLDDAIDIHISLVQLKQLLMASLGEGIDFRSALTEAVHTMQSQRQGSGSSPANLYFRVKCVWLEGKKQWQTKYMEKAISLWVTHALPRSRARLEKRRRKEEDKLRRKAEAEQRRAHRCEQRAIDGRQRAEKKEQDKCSMQRARQRLQARKRMRAFISSALQQKDPSWKTWHAWKMVAFPEGLRLATLRFKNDCVCSVLTLQDGSERHGPLRKSIREAETDLSDLRALQRSNGDAAACTELQTRDVQAMTAFFASRLDQRSRR
mmetsp:Transcript_84252/g.272360  ORF Transcript_84252/g.272360 Transcript_84252/m.272360 type:complete len:604 (+) Transcript_84252:3-1814(+)